MKKIVLFLALYSFTILYGYTVVNSSTGNMLNVSVNISTNSGDPLNYENVNLVSVQPEENTERTDGCELLIITHPNFEGAANTLAAWKIRRGIYTKVVNTGTTGNTSSQIENYIDNTHSWTPAPEYLLFIGDAEYVPTCYETMHSSGGDQGHIGTDFFYAENSTPADSVADFGYGRLPVDSLSQADSLVARIIRYERNPTTNSDYYTNILNAAMFQDGEGDTGIDSVADRRFCKTSEDVRNYLATQGYSSQRVYCTNNAIPLNTETIYPTWWNDGTQEKYCIFQNDHPPYDVPLELQDSTFDWEGSGHDIKDAINNGKYFVLYNGHGYVSGWSSPIGFGPNRIAELSNGEDRPFIWSMSCKSGWFDNETDDAACGSDSATVCFAELMLRHNTGGSCGIIASTRRSSSRYNDRLVWGMMDAIWPDFLTWTTDPYGGSPDPIYRMGDVINYGKEYMYTRCDTIGNIRGQIVELYHWFGDPTTEMWTSEPIELTSAEVTSTINIGTDEITVQVYPPTEDMIVAICTENGDGIFGVDTTDASGMVTVDLNHEITMEGPVYITITKHDYIPYEFVVGWVTATWEGDNSQFWHDQKNWDINATPTNTMEVIIPDGTPYNPMVTLLDAECKNITVESWALLRISDENLTVTEDMTVHGELEMTQNTAKLYINGDITWESGSIANIIADDAEIWVKGIWEFKPGSNVQLDNGYVEFDGSTDGFITTKSVDSYFNHIISRKDGGASLYYSGPSTEDLIINGNLYNFPDSKIQTLSGHNIILNGSLMSYIGASFQLGNGIFVLDGTTQNVSLNTLDYFNNLTISSSGNTNMNSDIALHGNLLIESGALVTNNHDIRIEGNWTNTVGTAGFTEGTSRVIIWGGDYPQYCNSNETFYELELNKMWGGSFCIDGSDVTCAAYDWTAGAVEVLSGSFTANSLVDDGINGAYYLYSGGTIDLNNPDEWVDLNGEIHIFGGTMTVVGSISEWPYSHEALIEMSGGVLDFPECGINLTTSHTLTTNITGGTIRTAERFIGLRTDFNPTGGTIELYGSIDANLSMGVGSNFYNVLINKAASDEITKKSKNKKRKFHDRNGSVIKLTRSYRVNVSSELDINGDFILDTGIFNTNGFDMYVAGDWANNVGDTGFLEETQTVTFDGADYADILTNETFYDLVLNKTTSAYYGLELASGSSLNVLNDLTISDGTLEMNNSSTLSVVNDINIAFESGLNAFGNTGIEIYVGGDWTNDNTEWNSTFGYSPGIGILTFNGSTDQFITTQAPQEDFGNLVIDKSGGEFRSNDNIRVINDLDILAGCWHDNISSLTHYFEGDFYITAGTAACWNSLTNNIIVFTGTEDQTVYNPNGYHYFGDVVVDKTAWPTRSIDIHEGVEMQQERINNVNLDEKIRTLTVTLTSNIDIQNGNGLTIEEGTLDLNGNNIYSMGDVIINDGGKIIVDEGAQLQVYGGDELNVNGGGTLEVQGIPGNLATITQRSTGYYAFNIYQEGTISAEYGLFEYMTSNGVYVWVDGIIDPLHSFDYCTFKNGFVGSGTFLYIDNADDITITGANFPDPSSITYNVAKIEDQGTITMNNATGIFAGEAYEHDPNTRIDWEGLPEIDDLTIQYNAGTNQIELSWTYPVPVVQYNIYRSLDPYDFSGADVFISNTESYSETATETKYFYYVTAENISDNGVTGKP